MFKLSSCLHNLMPQLFSTLTFKFGRGYNVVMYSPRKKDLGVMYFVENHVSEGRTRNLAEGNLRPGRNWESNWKDRRYGVIQIWIKRTKRLLKAY